MIALYIVCAIVGGGLVAVSALTGHGDHSADHGGFDHGGHDISVDHGGIDHGHDIGGDHGGLHGHVHDAQIWVPFFSLRFWTYFFAVFGVGGLLLANFGGTKEPSTGIFAGITGFLVGTLVAYGMRIAQRMEADSSSHVEDFLGMSGTVVVAIRPGSAGKIRVNLKGDIIELLALPNDNETLEIGSEAVIVTMENDRARVMSRATLLEENQLNA